MEVALPSQCGASQLETDLHKVSGAFVSRLKGSETSGDPWNMLCWNQIIQGRHISMDKLTHGVPGLVYPRNVPDHRKRRSISNSTLGLAHVPRRSGQKASHKKRRKKQITIQRGVAKNGVTQMVTITITNHQLAIIINIYQPLSTIINHNINIY